MQLSMVLSVLLSEGGSPIDLDGTFLIQLAIFAACFLLLRSLVINPVMGVIEARTLATAGAKAQASQMESEAAAKHASFENQLHAVHQESLAQREQTRADAQKLARDLTDKARAETDAHLSQTLGQLNRDTEKLRADAQAQVAILAARVSSRLLGREVR